MSGSLYEHDFYAWANEQAALIRAGNLAAVDLEHVAEEIESMGKTEKRELVSRLAVLLLHLLKWRFQPERRGNSWRLSISNQRRQLRRHLRDNPSLKSALPEALDDAYGDAVNDAAGETGLSVETFSPSCIWSFDQILDDGFWPSAG